MMEIKIPKDILNRIINESSYPVVIKNILRNDNNECLWKLLEWDFDELSKKIDIVKLPFRTGVNNITVEPQWEYKCETKHLTMSEFLEISKSKKDTNWYYFDYKYMHEWFKDNKEILSSIDWKLLGCDMESESSTIWIGNKGAHTNCHRDTYGSNIIAQIHGRKQWILYPPEVENFRETRDPYEESTIYTKINFFTPNSEEINHLKSLKHKPRIVTLESGDVLFVPHGWWHFVESLDTSLSVNVWIPLKTDCYDRLSEAFVKLLVNNIASEIPIVNDSDKNDLRQCLNFIKQSLDECKIVEQQDKKSGMKLSTSKLNNTLENVLKDYSNCAKIIEEITFNEYDDFLNARKSRFSGKNCNIDMCNVTETRKLESEIINAFCNTKIIRQILDCILE